MTTVVKEDIGFFQDSAFDFWELKTMLIVLWFLPKPAKTNKRPAGKII